MTGILFNSSGFFHTITGDVLRNKATAFEAKEFRTAANKPEYFDGIARGLTNLNNTQIPGGMQPANAERPPDGMNPTLLSTLMAAASAGVTQRNLNTSQNLQFLMQAGGVPVSQGPMAALQLHQASGGVGLTAYQSFLQQNHVRNVQMSLQEMQAILTAGVYPTVRYANDLFCGILCS